ncbi:MAG TPA: hypothetical protein VFQ83_11730 [Candidatus Udaeobacter sp.]|jgi:hypothetical protein|nr:hypothetical protein [Candidatus Udaeobacter sp.]
MNPRYFFPELKRRNVIRAAILYLGAVWALAQKISQLARRSARRNGRCVGFWSLQGSGFRFGLPSPGSTSSRREV